MDHGRSICNVLKSVRKAIADANGIRYEPAECGFEGECRGTCLACEAELRYIERELSLRRMAGRAVTVAGIALGAAALTACGRDTAQQFEQPKTTVNANEHSEMFGLVEEMPSFPGGQKALMDYISTHLRNPNPENKLRRRPRHRAVCCRQGRNGEGCKGGARHRPGVGRRGVAPCRKHAEVETRKACRRACRGTLYAACNI